MRSAEGRPCLSRPAAFCDGLMASDGGRAMDAIYLEPCKAFTRTLTTSSSLNWRCALEGWAVQWIEVGWPQP